MSGAARQRRRLRRFGALAVCTGGLWLWTAPSALAVGKLETGVWWRDQTGAATLPAPPQVPPGGLWVSNDPAGPSAISAVRITLADAEGFPALSLHVAQLTAQPVTPAMPVTVSIRACVVTGAWTAPVTFPGQWAARPSYDCAKGSTVGKLSPDQRTIVFDLTVLPAGHGYSLALVPGAPVAPVPDPTQATGSPTFDITFEPPKPSDVAVLPTAPGNPVTPAAGSDIAVGPAPFGAMDASPLPGVAAQQTPTVAPTAVVPMRPRPLAAPVAKVVSTSRAVRTIAGLVFCAFAAWAWRVLAWDSAGGSAATDDRDPLGSSHPAPLGTESGLRRRFGSGRRTGPPPALR